MFRRIFAIILLLTVSGCTFGTKNLDVISRPVDRVPLTVYDPQRLELQDIEWFVITRENADEVFDELEERGLYPVVFGLSGTGYKALAVNVDEIKQFMILQKAIIDAYRSYYEK